MSKRKTPAKVKNRTTRRTAKKAVKRVRLTPVARKVRKTGTPRKVVKNPVPGKYTQGGRVYKTLYFFSVESTNNWLESHPGYGVIGVESYNGVDRFHVARLQDMGKRAKRSKSANPAKSRSKSKPVAKSAGLSKAAKTHADFIGKPLSQVKTRQIQIAVRTPDNLAEIAPLVKIKLKTPAGAKEIRWSGSSRPMLLANAGGTQLYLHGGSQNLDPAKLGTTAQKFLSKDLIVLGLITEISYEAQKRMHNFRLTEYYHKASEDTLADRGHRGPQVFINPMLVLDRLNRRLLIIGGTYRIKAPGIID